MSKEPYCWRATGGSIWGHKTSHDDVPLYDQSAIDAAVSEERERCAKVAEKYGSSDNSYAKQIAVEIREIGPNVLVTGAPR